MNEFAAIGIVFYLFLILLAILWALVPFAVFGIKPILRQILAELVAARKERSADRSRAVAASLNGDKP